MCIDSIFGPLSLILASMTGKTPAAFVDSESRPLLADRDQQPGQSASIPGGHAAVQSSGRIPTVEAPQVAPPPPRRTLPKSDKRPPSAQPREYLVLTSCYDPTVDMTVKDPYTDLFAAPDLMVKKKMEIGQIRHLSTTFYLTLHTQSAVVFNDDCIMHDKPVDFEGPLPEFLSKAEPTLRVLVLTGAVKKRPADPLCLQGVPAEAFERETPSLTHLLLRYCHLNAFSTLGSTVKHLRLEYGADSPFGHTFVSMLRSTRDLQSLELFSAIPPGIRHIGGRIGLPCLQILFIAIRDDNVDLRALQFFFGLLRAPKDLRIQIVCTDPRPRHTFATQVRSLVQDWRFSIANEE
ncbi:hypothetical protein HGRIS_012104 [Hohenbuehelia grisea]|uniref:Uncharacterized protein n=1 Tax=Hohenbuehelia grisea TaxID=104357 RepID=A0ABR3IRA6_9AGAR